MRGTLHIFIKTMPLLEYWSGMKYPCYVNIENFHTATFPLPSQLAMSHDTLQRSIEQ